MSFDELVAEVVRTKREADRIGGLLIVAENAHTAALRTLDRAIADACRTTPVQPLRTRERNHYTCSKCGLVGHSKLHCPELLTGNSVVSETSNGELHR